jgi:hypothetical protein
VGSEEHKSYAYLDYSSSKSEGERRTRGHSISIAVHMVWFSFIRSKTMTAIPLILVGVVVIGDGHIDPSDKRDGSNSGQCLVRMSRSCFGA